MQQQEVFFKRELNNINVKMFLLQDTLDIHFWILASLSKSMGITDFYYYCEIKDLTNKCNIISFCHHDILLKKIFFKTFIP